MFSLVRCSAKKLLSEPCCYGALYQLYTNSSIIHQCIKSSSMSKTSCFLQPSRPHQMTHVLHVWFLNIYFSFCGLRSFSANILYINFCTTKLTWQEILPFTCLCAFSFVPFDFIYFIFVVLFYSFFSFHHSFLFLSQGSLFQKSTEPKEHSALGIPCKLMFYVLQ